MKKVPRKRTLQVTTMYLKAEGGLRLVCDAVPARPCAADLTVMRTKKKKKKKKKDRRLAELRQSQAEELPSPPPAQGWKHLLGCINAQAHSH